MRIATLTGLRGVAAVCVLLYHIPHQPAFERFAMPLFSRAYLAVDLFFILSGFVISLGYHERVVKHPGMASYADFLINRMARVWPLHFIAMLVYGLRVAVNISGSQTIDLDVGSIIANLLMVQSWGWGTVAIAGNSWSVSTELAAYLLYPLIAIAAFSRWAGVQAAICVALFAVVAASGLGASGPMDVINGDSVLPLLRCLAGFSLGVLTYRVAEQPWSRRVVDRPGGFAMTCGLIAAALMLPRGDIVVVCLMPALVLSCYYDGRAARAAMANPISLHLGLISYSIYLWHPLVRDVAARAMGMAQARGWAGFDWLFVVLAIAATWLLCWISYLLIEVRGHRLVKRLQARWRLRPKTIGAAA